MVITSIQITRRLNTGTKLVATVAIVLDDMVVIHDIKILEKIDGLFLGMPSKPTNVGTFMDIVHPINREVREVFEKLTFTAYQMTVDQDLVRAEYIYNPQDDVSLFEQTFEMFLPISPDGRAMGTAPNNMLSQSSDTTSGEMGRVRKAKEDDELLKWLES